MPHSRMQTSLRFWQCLTNEHRQRAKHACVRQRRTITRFGCFSWLCSEWVASNRIPQEFSCHAIGKKGPDFVHFGTRMSGGCIGGRGAGEAGVYLFAAPVQ